MEPGREKGASMERCEFEKCCQAVEEGVQINLENTSSHIFGKVIFCRNDEFEVEVNGERQRWLADNCEELSSSSEGPRR